MTRVHRWGSPSEVMSFRLPRELAERIREDAARRGGTKSDVCISVLAEAYDYPIDNLFDLGAQQLPLADEEPPENARPKGRNTRRAA